MADEEILIPIPRVNPLTFNTYANTFLTTYDLKNSAIIFKITDADVTGVKGFIHVPYACTITAYSLLADASGDIVIDIWKDVFASFPPTVADSITAAAKPTLAAAQGVQSSVLTGWTTAIAAGDILAYNIDSVVTITQVTLTLFVTKTV